MRRAQERDAPRGVAAVSGSAEAPAGRAVAGGVRWPVRIGTMPRPAAFPQYRAALSAHVAHVLGELGAVVLAGAGGVGKSQSAVAQARRLREAGEADLLIWVTASTRQAIVEAYAQAAAEIFDVAEPDSARAAQKFLLWLEQEPGARPVRWLIVFDDVVDPADLRALWPPYSPFGG